jgi:hypothetical protein
VALNQGLALEARQGLAPLIPTRAPHAPDITSPSAAEALNRSGMNAEMLIQVRPAIGQWLVTLLHDGDPPLRQHPNQARDHVLF